MAAAPVGVDGPAEGHPGRFGDLVDDRTGLDLEERDATEAWCVEGPGDGTALEQCQFGLGWLGLGWLGLGWLGLGWSRGGPGCAVEQARLGFRLVRVQLQCVPAHVAP